MSLGATTLALGNVTVAPDSISSTLTIGVASIDAGLVELQVPSIVSTLTTGTPTALIEIDVTTASIASSLSLGLAIVLAEVDIEVPSISSNLLIGTTVLTPLLIAPISIAAGTVVGTARIIIAGTEIIIEITGALDLTSSICIEGSINAY